MAKVRRVFPYVNGRQTFTMPTGYDPKVVYHAWGGGGAAGGDSNSNLGGNGSSGTYTTGEVLINPGETVEIFVGQGGQEGQSSESNKKLYSCTIDGTGAGGVGPTASYGWVNDPTKAVYPQYNDPLATRSYSRWNAFMNNWAVSNLPSNQSGTEEVNNNVYFPEPGNYTMQVSCDNSIVVTFRDKTYTASQNFGNGPSSFTISVPSAGVYELRYVLTNQTGGSGNPAGAAIVITRPRTSAMGGGTVQTYPGGVSTKDIIWTTRYGVNVDVSNRVPILYAPVLDFYQPQSSYSWGGIPNQGLAFVSATNTWTDQQLENLNLNRDKIITIGYPVLINCKGNVDQVMASGYYTFAQGQTWELARYNWLGNPQANTNMLGRGTGTPSNWTERQWYNDNTSGRSRNVTAASWTLPVPPDNQIYIVGFADGVIYNAPSQRGSDNLTWTVSSTVSQTYNGGPGGASAINIGNKNFNYFGGYGGQIGDGKTSGGGGGGGGATIILKKTPGSNTVTGLTIAGGGGGGGGAGFNSDGRDGSNEYIAASAYPYSIGAGRPGQGATSSGGGGGGGGGGCDGGNGGAASIDGLGSGGEGAFSGGSQVVPSIINLPQASLVMIGRGGDGGNGGGGGGAGELVVTDNLQLRNYQYIQVGGTGGERLEGGPSAVWWTDTEYVTAGPGGRGGQLDAAYGRSGNGQNGGCVSGDTATRTYGGSGGGGGTNPRIAGAGGGAANPSRTVVERKFTSYVNAGGSGSNGAGGGGGGAGGTSGTGQIITSTYQQITPQWGTAVPVTSGLIPTYLGSSSGFNVWFPTASATSYTFYLKFTANRNGYGIIGNSVFEGTITIGDNWSLDIRGSTVLAKFKDFYPKNTGYYKVTITSRKSIYSSPEYGFAMIVMDNDLVASYAYNSLQPGQYGMTWSTLNYGTPPAIYQTTQGTVATSSGQANSGGNGGAGRTVSLGQTGKTYRLGGGGGGAAPNNSPGALFIGLGSDGGGDGSTGTGPGVEFNVAKNYTFYVPRNTSQITMQGIAGGGGGGNGATVGSGGGGSGGYLPPTTYAVQPGQRIDVTVGKGGNSGANGENTVIRINAAGDIDETIITLGGGQAGSNNPSNQPAGGAGGTPNGNQGQPGNQGSGPFAPYSGRGADSQYGRGGDNCQCDDTRSKPSNGYGYGSGGGGGGPSRNGGLGAQGYVQFSWTGGYTVNAQANTGSGGGGGFDGGSGQGGSGFVAIAYPGSPIFVAKVNRQDVAPIQQNGYTIHEFYSSGELILNTGNPGSLDRGSSIYPGGAGVPGYVPGTAVGGVGNNNLNVFPVRSSAYPQFLNDYGVWNQDSTSASFDRTYYVYFPETASYFFRAYADNGATVRVDDGLVLDMTPATRDNGSYWYKNGATTVKKLTVGLHKVTISATNLTAQGAFAMTIVKDGTSNPLIFNSRQPPVPEGSAVGGNGLVILELVGGEGTAQVKVDNAWRKLIGQWVKVGGTWKKITDSSVKVGGVWQSLFGAKPFDVTIDQNYWGGPPSPGTYSPPTVTQSGGGGGGCKIICQALYDLGLMDEKIYQADQKFGEMLRTNDPAAYWGYVKWASVVVDWIEGSGPQCMFWIRDPERRSQKQRELATRWAYRIATPWAQHMAYRMGTVDHDSRAGRWIMKSGLAISRLIGRCTGAKEPSKNVALGYSMWAVFCLFWLLAGVRGN